jgi:hypothetical protein
MVVFWVITAWSHGLHDVTTLDEYNQYIHRRENLKSHVVCPLKSPVR